MHNFTFVQYKSQNHFKMKKIILLLFAFLMSWQINAQVTTFANPDTTGKHLNEQIVFNGNLYFKYIDANNKNRLAEFNGTTTTVIANPDTGAGLVGSSIVYNSNLYFIYQGSSGGNSQRLAKFDGTTITLITDPFENPVVQGVSNSPIIYNNSLYYTYKNNLNKIQLVKFDGTSLTKIANPDTGSGIIGKPIVYDNNLYFQYQNSSGIKQLVKCDGTTTTQISNPDAASGVTGNPIIYNTKLYLPYLNSTNKQQILSFDGITASLIANPDTTGDISLSPIVYNGNLYFTYRNASSNYQLSKFDGTTLSLIANPTNDVGLLFDSFVVHNNNLFFTYAVFSIYQLAKYDGTTITRITNPNGGYGVTGKPFTFNNSLFFTYSSSSTSAPVKLTKYDGTTISIIANENTNDGGFSTGIPFLEFNGKIYNNYSPPTSMTSPFPLTKLGVYSDPCTTPTPTAAAQTFCGSKTVADLVATGTGTFNWYNVATGGTALAASTPLTNTTTYYVTQTISGCESPRTSVAVTINAVPTATATSNSPICQGQTLQLTGTGTGTYLWTAPNNGGTSAQQNPFIPSASPSNSGTYTLKITGANGCTTTVSTVVVVIPNTAPTAVSPQTLTTGSTIAAIAITATGSAVTWYDASTAGNVLSTTTTLVNGSSYYVSQTTNGCESARKQITVNLVAPVTVSPATATVCTGLVTELTASSMLTPTSNSGKIGTGTVFNQELFFNGAWGNTKSQALYTATELTALGLVAGSSINSIGFVMEAGSATATFNNFNLSAGLVAQQTVTNPATDFIAGANTTVFSSASYTPNAAGGTIDYPLATPIIWDGSSALLVQGCFTNSNSGNNITGFRKLETTFYTTPNERSISALKDNVFDACTEMFANFTNKGSNENRPNLRVSYSNANTITWLPITGLYTNPAATTAYVTGANASSVYAKPTATITYTATSSNGISTATATSAITVNPNPTATQLAITRSGDVFTIAVAGATYQWYQIVNSVGVLISGATNQSYTATATGSYYAEVTINGCLAETDFVTVTTLGTNDFEFNSKLSVYPNPSNTIFNIDIDSNATIEVYDLVGKQILTKKIELGTSQLDMSNYNTGMYLLKVTNADNQTKTMKIVKQ
jgi:trimeric autotransporter adhesin